MTKRIGLTPREARLEAAANQFIPLALQIILLCLLIGHFQMANAQSIDAKKPDDAHWLDLAQQVDQDPRLITSRLFEPSHHPEHWALALDNDILVPAARDQDYTYGVNVSQSGPGIGTASLSFNKPLRTLDESVGFTFNSPSVEERYIREFGLFGFTPEDISVKEPNPHDRPYASLVYFSSAREQIDWISNRALKSTLTLGLLGTDITGNLQNRVHKYTDSNPAEGWENQISQGGEITARYQLALQQLLELTRHSELKSTLQLSVGYLTEVSAGLSFRRGNINSSWASFNPDLTSYGEKASFDRTTNALDEHYFWGGVALKARAYNAFLEGQLRHSAVTYHRGELNSFLVEAWLGYTLAFQNGFRVSYVLRGHTSEVRHGEGDRDLLWGSLTLARAI